MTLHALQAATTQTSSSDYINASPVGDYQYQVDLANNGLKEQEVPDDLYAAGWDGLITTDAGNNPVRFERPDEA